MEQTSERARKTEERTLALVQQNAAGLLRFACRFSLCADDAQDAYQRSIEILVRRMRTDPPDNVLPWIRTVLRNEALAVRAEREKLVGREEVDFDRHRAAELEDPAERIDGFEQLAHVAEALQRLKPQEVTALVLRSEGLSYKEICTRQSWTWTKTNRAITEGRRALRKRLGEIESGAECERWLPLLSALADGEATARELADLRPHLRACTACRATLRDFHDAPRAVAALVPIAVVPAGMGDPGSLSRHLEAVFQAVAERVTLTALRVHGALDTLAGTKMAAVAASTAALAGGGVAIEHVAHASARPVAHAQRAAAAGGTSLLSTATRSIAPRSGASTTPAATASRSSSGTTSEFAFEATEKSPRPPRHARSAATTTALFAQASPRRQTSPPPASTGATAPAEFAGP